MTLALPHTEVLGYMLGSHVRPKVSPVKVNKAQKRKNMKLYRLFAMCLALSSSLAAGLDSTPKLVKIGETEFIFYKSAEKNQYTNELVKNLNDKKLLLTVEMYEDPYYTTEIASIASIAPESIMGMALDPTGNRVLDEYADKVMQFVKNEMNIKIEAHSRELNLIVSQDAHKFHQDQFKKQYDYLYANHHELPKCCIIHDLTLIDWNMSKGTISGTIFQDEGGDRLLIALFPDHTVSIITAEQPAYPADNSPPVFPGPTTLPYHAVLSPVDFEGSLSSGSSKGQRISTVIRGIVREDAFKDIRHRATSITPYRSSRELDENNLTTLKYENGITLKQFMDIPKVNLAWNLKTQDQENTEILKTDPKENREIIAEIQSMFNLSNISLNDIEVRHLIKKDGGFSRIDKMDLNIPDSYDIVLINSSTLPKQYRYYNIAEDLTKLDFPWIHLYEFHPNMAMHMNQEMFKNLSLTPLEELIYRDEVIDNKQIDGLIMQIKPVTRIDVFAFPRTSKA